MKKWNEPQMRMYDVKLDENLAVSAGEPVKPEKTYEIGYITHTNGIISRGGADYKYDANGYIQDTQIQYINDGEKFVYDDQVNAISGCLA